MTKSDRPLNNVEINNIFVKSLFDLAKKFLLLENVNSMDIQKIIGLAIHCRDLFASNNLLTIADVSDVVEKVSFKIKNKELKKSLGEIIVNVANMKYPDSGQFNLEEKEQPIQKRSVLENLAHEFYATEETFIKKIKYFLEICQELNNNKLLSPAMLKKIKIQMEIAEKMIIEGDKWLKNNEWLCDIHENEFSKKFSEMIFSDEFKKYRGLIGDLALENAKWISDSNSKWISSLNLNKNFEKMFNQQSGVGERLESLLILAIQRLPRHELLTRGMHKETGSFSELVKYLKRENDSVNERISKPKSIFHIFHEEKKTKAEDPEQSQKSNFIRIGRKP